MGKINFPPYIVSFLITLLVLSFMFSVAYFVSRAIKTLTTKSNPTKQKRVLKIYWGIHLFYIIHLFVFRTFVTDWMPSNYKLIVGVSAIVFYFSLTFIALILLFEEIYISLRKVGLFFFAPKRTINQPSSSSVIPRSEFIAKSALAFGALPLGLVSYGVIKSVYDYQVKKQKIFLPNLPKAFDGLTIAQISDLHCGQFVQMAELKRGIELLLAQKTDLIFFTGDLVNYDTDEAKPFFQLLQKIKAPLGVFSILGNHDYGDYRQWPNQATKAQNLALMKTLHQQLDWQLLDDKSSYLTQNQEKIAILGVGNWGTRGRFPKYGKLEMAYENTREAEAKILLSHDPTHWDAQIRMYSDIDLTLSGHTHGMQMGIEWGSIRLSPAQILFEQWAGLYQKNKQFIYVNRGFGFSEIFPARMGILPEITVFELKKG
jgi:predicted MPP superfamily phosphohydrolase